MTFNQPEPDQHTPFNAGFGAPETRMAPPPEGSAPETTSAFYAPSDVEPPPPAGEAFGGSTGYAPPVTAAPVMGSYRPGGGRAMAAIVLLAIIAVLNGIGSLLEVQFAQPFMQQARGELIEESTLIAAVLVFAVYGLVYFGVYVAAIVAVCMWFHRAHKNLPALGATGLTYTPGWAVGWFFVPFMNLVRPCQVMSEIWKASDPRSVKTPGEGWRHVPVAGLVGLWWGTWILANLLGKVSWRSGMRDSADALFASTITSVLSSLVAIVSGVALIQLIRGVGRNQDRRYALVTNPGVAPTQTPGMAQHRAA